MPKTFSLPVVVSIPHAGEFTVNLKVSPDDINIPEDVTVASIDEAAYTIVRDRIRVRPDKGASKTVAGQIRAYRTAAKRQSE